MTVAMSAQIGTMYLFAVFACVGYFLQCKFWIKACIRFYFSNIYLNIYICIVCSYENSKYERWQWILASCDFPVIPCVCFSSLSMFWIPNAIIYATNGFGNQFLFLYPKTLELNFMQFEFASECTFDVGQIVAICCSVVAYAIVNVLKNRSPIQNCHFFTWSITASTGNLSPPYASCRHFVQICFQMHIVWEIFAFIYHMLHIETLLENNNCLSRANLGGNRCKNWPKHGRQIDPHARSSTISQSHETLVLFA